MFRVSHVAKGIVLSTLVAVALLGAGCGGDETPGFGADTEDIRSRGGKSGGEAKPGFSGAGPAQRGEDQSSQAGEADSAASSDQFGDSGLSVRRTKIVLEPGKSGGVVEAIVLNSGDTLCNDVRINIDLVRRNKSLVGKIEILGSALEPGAETTLKSDFEGIGVSKAVATGGSCGPGP
jgi:hypothetical protein